MRPSTALPTGLILFALTCGLSAPTGAAAADNPRLQKRFDRMDANSDGKLDAAEIDAIKARRFRSFDLDSDGLVSADVIAMRWISNARRRGRLNKRRRQRIVRRAINLVRKHDTDGDRNLSLDEYRTIPLGFVRRGDANGDGMLTFEEYSAFVESRRDRRRKN